MLRVLVEGAPPKPLLTTGDSLVAEPRRRECSEGVDAREIIGVVEQAAELLRARGGRGGLVGPVRAGSVLFVGDTHGYPEVVEKAYRLADELSVEKLVFLGDYVDRGPRGAENLYCVLAGFLAEPDRVIVLRGNHEDMEMNIYYGFMSEGRAKLGSEGLERIYALYRYLPIAAVVNDWFVVHGGVPCRECTGEEEEPVTLDALRQAVSESWGVEGAEATESLHPLVFQMLWNDPDGGVEWFAPSIRGPGIYYYGRLAWRAFLERNGLKMVVRAHEAVDGVVYWDPEGERHKADHGQFLYEESMQNTVVTVFSSLYHGMAAAYLVYQRNNGEGGFTVIHYTP